MDDFSDDANNNKALVLKVLENGSITEGTKVDTTITVIYVATNTDGENYNLTFELDVSVEF